MKRKIIYLLMPCLLLLSTSCNEEFLEQTPTDAISANDALATPANMRLVISGLHRLLCAQNGTLLPGGSNSRAGEHFWLSMDDALVGNVIHSAPGNGWLRSELQWNTHTVPTSLSNQQMWYQRYHIIASTSAIINQVEDAETPVDEELADILGQAYAYRAYAYYQLITHYAKGYIIGTPESDLGVPLQTGSEPPFTSGPRATVQEIYDLMETDIDKAITFFGEAKARCAGSTFCKSDLNVNVAHGIKARIALSSGDWATAVSSAINAREGFPLMNEVQWKSGFNTLDLPEVIWGSNVIDTETVFFTSYFYYISNTFNGSQNRGNPKIFNAEIYNRIPDTDFRKDVVLPLAPNTNPSANNSKGGSVASDPNYNDQDRFDFVADSIRGVYGTVKSFNLHPYMHYKMKNKKPGSIDPDDIILMRSAEMYLIEAEAKAMQNDISGAQGALQALVETRNSAYDAAAFATVNALMDEIKFQWYVEMFGEGFGYENHIRWDEPLDLTDSGADPAYYSDGFQQDRPSVNDKWIWKIPQDEIDANPNLTGANQN
ncbi:MAG: RagB/SusD family nutrient uptake outer membrane protein [Ekhidna sp.]|nr:RagB/SusD family nutrient uptake outer membrane protein [Ekhidna sp.]